MGVNAWIASKYEKFVETLEILVCTVVCKFKKCIKSKKTWNSLNQPLSRSWTSGTPRQLSPWNCIKMFLLSAASKSSAAFYCCELQTMQDNALSVALMHESIYPMWVYIANSSSNKRKREETHSCARLAKKESHTTKQTWRPVERKREKTFINLAKYRNKGKKLNSFLSEAGEKSFQLANQPRKKGQGDSSNWHFVLTPFATQKFVPEKKSDANNRKHGKRSKTSESIAK